MDYSIELKKHLESTFSMPFDVTSSIVDGEVRYACCPSNEGSMYFTLTIYVHNNIRLVIDIQPQLHGGYILNDMALAVDSKKDTFFQYLSYLREDGAKVSFKVNGKELTDISEWPEMWKIFTCRITKLPIPEMPEQEILKEWCSNGIELIFSLLTITELEDDDLAIHTEGTRSEIRSIRYERNPINRKICLKRKGYTCAVCGINFYDIYGLIGKDYIEVHHTTPVSEMGEGYVFNIDRDLVPLCSNCHSMAHRRKPPYKVDELQAFIEEQSYGAGIAAEAQAEYKTEKREVIVGVVKQSSLSPFKDKTASTYYFGKHFPSKYNLKGIKYFAPYFDKGVRGYYDVVSVRTARKSEILQSMDVQDDDIRIILDLGDYHHLSDTPVKVALAQYNHALVTLSSLKEKNS